jgi:hypothetical protein
MPVVTDMHVRIRRMFIAKYYVFAYFGTVLYILRLCASTVLFHPYPFRLAFLYYYSLVPVIVVNNCMCLYTIAGVSPIGLGVG